MTDYTIPATTPEELAQFNGLVTVSGALKVTEDPAPEPVVELLHLQGNGWAILRDGEKYVRPGGRPFTSMGDAAAAAAKAFGCPADHPWERAPGVVSIYRQFPTG